MTTKDPLILGQFWLHKIRQFLRLCNAFLVYAFHMCVIVLYKYKCGFFFFESFFAIVKQRIGKKPFLSVGLEWPQAENILFIPKICIRFLFCFLLHAEERLIFVFGLAQDWYIIISELVLRLFVIIVFYEWVWHTHTHTPTLHVTIGQIVGLRLLTGTQIYP